MRHRALFVTSRAAWRWNSEERHYQSHIQKSLCECQKPVRRHEFSSTEYGASSAKSKRVQEQFNGIKTLLAASISEERTALQMEMETTTANVGDLNTNMKASTHTNASETRELHMQITRAIRSRLRRKNTWQLGHTAPAQPNRGVHLQYTTVETDLENFFSLHDVHRRPIAHYEHDLPHRQSLAEPMMKEFLSAPIEPNREDVESSRKISYFKDYRSVTACPCHSKNMLAIVHEPILVRKN